MEFGRQASQAIESQLVRRFPKVELMDALCIVHPRYWIGLVNEFGQDKLQILEVFLPQMRVLRGHFAILHLPSQDSKFDEDVPAKLDGLLLGNQASSFSTYMTNHAEHLIQKHGSNAVNVATTAMEVLWAQENLPETISEYVRLAHLCLSIPFGSVENERRFSAMNLTVTDLRNRFGEDHVNTELRIHSST